MLCFLFAIGYLAKVQCVEVWCPMTKEFYAEYIRRSVGNQSRLQRLLYTLNPRKFRACEYLVKHHTKRGNGVSSIRALTTVWTPFPRHFLIVFPSTFHLFKYHIFALHSV